MLINFLFLLLLARLLLTKRLIENFKHLQENTHKINLIALFSLIFEN